MFPIRIKEADPNERRRAGRLRCAEASCQFGPLMEISRSGLRCLTRRKLALPEGAFTHLKVACAGSTVTVAARPVYSRAAKGGFVTGFQFALPDGQPVRDLMALARAASTDDGCLGR